MRFIALGYTPDETRNHPAFTRSVRTIPYVGDVCEGNARVLAEGEITMMGG